MSEISNIDKLELSTLLAKQTLLNRRLLWLFLLPFAITAVTVAMFIVLNARLADVEVATKLARIEQILDGDKNYASAIDQYERISNTHSDAPILARLGMLYFRLDVKNENIAVQKLEAAKRLDPLYWDTYRSLCYIYTMMDRPKEAIEAGKKALELNANDVNTYNNLAWVYATSKEPMFFNLQLANEYAQKATELTKGMYPNYLDTLAEVQFRQGDRDRAIASLRKAEAIASDPDWAAQKIRDHFKRLFPNEAL